MSITPAQCRAARGLIPLTQQQLADASGVSLRTIAHFEKGERVPISSNIAAIRRALEEAGVRFIERGVELCTEEEVRAKGRYSRRRGGSNAPAPGADEEG